MAGRDFVNPEDVKAIAGPPLAHQLTLQPEFWARRVRAESVIQTTVEAASATDDSDPAVR